MDYQFAVGVADGSANIQEKPKPGFQVQTILAGMDRQRRTVDELHDQVRLTVFGNAAVQQARDAWVLQAGENETLAVEMSVHFVAAEERRQQLYCNTLFELAVVAFREVNNAHTAAANFVQQAVWTDSLRSPADRLGAGGLERVCIEENFGLRLESKQRFHFPSHLGVGVSEQSHTLRRGQA
jgi:hypothetical protein